MSDPIKLGADDDLRRLLEQPAYAPRPRRPLIASAYRFRLCVALADALQLVVLGLILRPAFPAAAATFSLDQTVQLGLLAAMLAVAARLAMRPPGQLNHEDTHATATRASLANFLAVMIVASLCWVTLSQSTTPSPQGRTAWFVAWAIAASCGAAGLRFAGARIAVRLRSGRNALIIGTADQARAIGAQLCAGPPGQWRVAGSFDDAVPGAIDAAVELVVRGNVDVVIIAVTGPDMADRMARVVNRLADQPVRISLALDTPGLPRGHRMALLDLADDPHGGLGGMAKRGLDLLLSGAALLLLSPGMMLVALAIKLDSQGPVFFRQWRFGVGGHPIEVLKFRSMTTEARDVTGERFTQARDPRVTRLGRILRRTSIDELPQLLNVLRGDMSLIGPRPHPLHMRVGSDYYFEAVARYRLRHRIRPGLTGWAQVNGSRGAVDTLEKAHRRVELDLYYIENWSLWLDLRILARTVMGGFLSLDAD